MDDVYLTRALEWKTALKEHDPGRRPVFSHVASPTIGSGAEWRWAGVGDFFGNSNYPAWRPFDDWDDTAGDRSWHASALQEMWDAVMLRTDYTRCAIRRDRAFWGAEFQGGPISTNLHLGRTQGQFGFVKMMAKGPAYLVSFLVLFSSSQNLGGLAGSALLGTFQTARARAHASALSEQLVSSNPLVAERLQGGLVPLNQALNREAAVLSYNDTFWLVVGIALLAAAVLFTLIVVYRPRKVQP